MFRRLRTWLAGRFWYVYPHTTLLVDLPAAALFKHLEAASVPSKERLHLQEIFVGGRRYRLKKTKDGFSVLTTGKTYWRYTEGLLRARKRTRAAARLLANVTELDAGLTRVEIKTHMRLGYLIDVLWVPLFFSSIVWFMPWPWYGVAWVIVTMFALSFGYHYYQALFQANEMSFFIHKALKDHAATDIPELATTANDTLFMDQFASEWNRFYRSHSDDR